jgi:periplasmic divalent cation tolerance protein
MGACVVWTAVAGAGAARKLAKGLVSRRLAACVSVLPDVKSHYRWKNRFATSSETLLFIKTTSGMWPRVSRFIKKHHPYELPEILALPVTRGSREYLSWLEDCLKK